MQVFDYYIEIKGMEEKTVAFISDCHLTEYDEFSDEAEVTLALQKTKHWMEARNRLARDAGETTGEAEQLPSIEQLELLLEEAKKADAIVFGGDMLDYVNASNVRILENHLKELQKPYIYVCGNHDHAKSFPDGLSLSRIKETVQKIDLGAVWILGLDNASRTLTEEQFVAFKEVHAQAMAEGKKILLVMHIPFLTENNPAMEVREEYFKFNYRNCPEINLEFMRFVQESDVIAAVLTGHLHGRNVSALTEKITQYVSSQGIVGRMNRFHVGEVTTI